MKHLEDDNIVRGEKCWDGDEDDQKKRVFILQHEEVAEGKNGTGDRIGNTRFVWRTNELIRI